LKRIDKIQGDAENICSQSVLFLKKSTTYSTRECSDTFRLW